MTTLTRPACYPHPDCPACQGDCTDPTGSPCAACEGYGGQGMCDECRAYADGLNEFHRLTDQWPADRRMDWLIGQVFGRAGEE